MPLSLFNLLGPTLEAGRIPSNMSKHANITSSVPLSVEISAPSIQDASDLLI